MDKTSKKRPLIPFRGAIDGVPFSKDIQPDPALKKAGWEQWRKERHLTQTILKELIGEDGKPKQTLSDYVGSLLINAKMGNSKAIETINKCLEDDVIKVDLSGETIIRIIRDKEL